MKNKLLLRDHYFTVYLQAQDTEEDMIHSLIEMTNTLNVDLVATDTCYNPLYERYNYSFSRFISLNRFTESFP